MLMLLALGVMSVTWMSVIAVLIVGQKLLPPRAPIDVPLALAIVALGALVLLEPLGGSRAHATDVNVNRPIVPVPRCRNERRTR